MNTRYHRRLHAIELQTFQLTTNPNALQKTIDFLGPFVYGFEVNNALALVHLEDIFMEEFSVSDVKLFAGDNDRGFIGTSTFLNVCLTFSMPFFTFSVVRTDIEKVKQAFKKWMCPLNPRSLVWRAVGRIAGKRGQIKYAIKNATRTRIALNDQRINLVGTANKIRLAKHVICNFVMGISKRDNRQTRYDFLSGW
jgi:RNA-binding protein PNO1